MDSARETQDVRFRSAREEDREFLRQMHEQTDLWEDPDGELSESFAEDDIRYVDQWTEDDGGVIAYVGDEGASTSIGAAWLRRFTTENPGWGFVADEYPEVAIALVPEYTGRGLGGKLMQALLDFAREHGYPGVSLSVEAGNARARRAYEKAGYRTVVEDDGAGGVTMLHQF